MSDRMFELADQLKALREAKKQTEQEVKSLVAQIDEVDFALSAFVKEQKSENEDTLPQWLEGLVNLYEKTTVGVRKD